MASEYFRNKQVPSVYDTIQKFGRLPDMDAADTNEDVWDGTGAYTGWLSSNTTITVSSSDANDTSAGTGARTVKVFGITLDANSKWQAISETATLNGQTAVTLSNQYIRIYRMYVTSVGSGTQNAGVIYAGSGTVTAGVPANVYAQINAGLGQTLMAIYSVPEINEDGQEYEIVEGLRWYASVGASQDAFATVAIQANVAQNGWRTFRTYEIAEGNGVDQLWTFGSEIAPKTDIRLRVLTNGVNNSVISGGFDLRMW